MDLLHVRCRRDRTFRDICIIAMYETWLDGTVPEVKVSQLNHRQVWQNMTVRKDTGWRGGVCVYIHNRFTRTCTHPIWRGCLCPCVPPYYLLSVVFSCVYIASDANDKTATVQVAKEATAMLTPGALVFTPGGLTHLTQRILPSLRQYVNIPTRRGNILDVCYGNISNIHL